MRAHFLQKMFRFLLVHNSEFLENLIKNIIVSDRILMSSRAEWVNVVNVLIWIQTWGLEDWLIFADILPIFLLVKLIVIQMLESTNHLLHRAQYEHSYPYDWRTKQPIIIRASKQWFVDTAALRDRASVSYSFVFVSISKFSLCSICYKILMLLHVSTLLTSAYLHSDGFHNFIWQWIPKIYFDSTNTCFSYKSKFLMIVLLFPLTCIDKVQKCIRNKYFNNMIQFWRVLCRSFCICQSVISRSLCVKTFVWLNLTVKLGQI